MSTKIDQALVTAFINGAFGLPIAHENVTYTPTPGTAFVELKVFQNPVEPYDLTNTDDVTGLLQFALNYPEGGGAIAAKEKADAIFAAFPVGLVLTYSGQSVEVTAKHRFRADPEDGWYRLIGRITFRASLAR